MSDAEIAQRAREYLQHIVEDELPNIEKEIKEARKHLADDRRWYGSDADTGYLDTMRQAYSNAKAKKSALEMVLGTHSFGTSAKRDEK